MRYLMKESMILLVLGAILFISFIGFALTLVNDILIGNGIFSF
jgi:hypothetical protein